jgi:16S rRNA (uracil1498-N3)-methyltransferase
MHRFYLPPEHGADPALRIEGREAHHALHVLRMKRGESVIVLDGVGHEFLCEAADVSREAVTLRVTQKISNPPLPCQITLLQALPRGKIIESIIQKSVELGAHRIVPLLTDRVVTQLNEKDRASKQSKWQLVAIEAIKQCGAAWLPKIEMPMTIAEVISQKPETGSESAPGSSPSAFDLSLVGSLQTDRRHPRVCFQEFQATHGRLPHCVAVWIGPEGDFTPDELKTIQASGAQPISLGPLVLRVETAAIYCLSNLNYELQAAAGIESKREKPGPDVPGA